MAGTALYREWRPKTFREVVEQEHVVNTLRNSVIYGRLSHAYLFSGTRGSGKTTLAHILSRAVNCESAKNNGGEPCNTCDMCLDILAGRCMDVVEIDAASNNGVDHIRSLRADIVYAPSAAKYKVYIIDEVHMLSGGAFNALLKTLEEPPVYAIFILATTEPHKLPATVLSRCQRFDFRRITPASIAARLEKVAESSGANVTSGALTLISGLADGSLRDAISILDQCLSFGEKNLTRETVLDVVGLPEDDMLLEFARILIERDLKAIPAHTSFLLHAGKSLTQYLESVTGFLRNALMMRISGGEGEFINMSDSLYKAAQTLADKQDLDFLLAATNETAALGSIIRHSTHQRAMIEVCLAKLCLSRFGSDSAIMELNTRITNLEAMLNQAIPSGHFNPYIVGSPQPQIQQQPSPVQQPKPSTAQQPPSPPVQQTPSPPVQQTPSQPAQPPSPPPLCQPPPSQGQHPPQAQEQRQSLTAGHDYRYGHSQDAVWQEIVGHFKITGNMRLFSMLQTATSKITADCFFIVLPKKTASLISVISLPVNIAEITVAVKEKTGHTYRIRVISEDTAKSIERQTEQYAEQNPSHRTVQHAEQHTVQHAEEHTVQHAEERGTSHSEVRDPLMELEKVMREKYNISTTVYS